MNAPFKAARQIFLAMLVALAACAPMTAPPGDMPAKPMIEGEDFIAHDGMHLPLRRWEPQGKPHAIVIALHGMSDYSNAFDGPGHAWAARGILTYAYDQRGFGRGTNRGLWAGGAAMRSDLRDCITAVHARWPGIPVFALGESMGGAVLLTTLAEPEKLDVAGAILVAPAVWSRGDMPLSYRVGLFLTAHIAPGLILSNNAASSVVKIIPSDNIEMLRALGRDPLFQKKTRVDTLFGLVNLMDAARNAPTQIENPPPLLLAFGRKDQVIPAAPTEAVVTALGPRASAVRRYDNGYHMLLRDLEGSKVQGDIADWMDATKPGP